MYGKLNKVGYAHIEHPLYKNNEKKSNLNDFNNFICWSYHKEDMKKKKIGLWNSSGKIMSYGTGFPLLFQFIKFIVLFFSIIFIFQGACSLALVIYIISNEQQMDLIDLDNFYSIRLFALYRDQFPEIVHIYDGINFLTLLIIIS